MNHVPGYVVWPVDQKSGALLLCYGCPLYRDHKQFQKGVTQGWGYNVTSLSLHLLEAHDKHYKICENDKEYTNGVLGKNSALQGYTRLGTTWAIKKNLWYESCPRCRINRSTDSQWTWEKSSHKSYFCISLLRNNSSVSSIQQIFLHKNSPVCSGCEK